MAGSNSKCLILDSCPDSDGDCAEYSHAARTLIWRRLLHSKAGACWTVPADNKEELVKQLERKQQDTKTRGKRVTEAARVAGEGMLQAWCNQAGPKLVHSIGHMDFKNKGFHHHDVEGPASALWEGTQSCNRQLALGPAAPFPAARCSPSSIQTAGRSAAVCGCASGTRSVRAAHCHNTTAAKLHNAISPCRACCSCSC